MSMNAPNNNNWVLGSGILEMDFWANGAKTGAFFDCGDCEKFTTDFSADMLTKNTNRNGSHGPVASFVTGVKGEATITLNEMTARFLSKAMLGTRSNLAQSGSTQTSVAIAASGIRVGASYYIGYLGVTAFVLKNSSTALTLGTDYTFNSETGKVTILGGAITDGLATINWSGTVPAITSTADTTGVGRSVINPLQAAKVQASIRFTSAADAGGQRYVVFIPLLQFSPSQALDWIKKDDTMTMELKGSIMMDTTQPAGQEYGTITEL